MKDKKGFLLGAGASYELGLPLVDELTIEFKRAMINVRGMPYYQVSKEIDEVLVTLLSDNSLNYEDYIGRIEVEIQRNRNKDLHQEWHGILHKYLEAIYHLLLERHDKNQAYIEAHLNFIEPIKEYCKNDPLWVFSLNHDVLIEIIAERFEIPIKFGFKDRVNVGGFTFDRLTREDMENNRFNFIQSGSGINLVRIHGALDIFVEGDEKNYLRAQGTKDRSGSVINVIRKLLENDPSLKQGVKCTNQITYHDEKNILQFLRMTIMSGKHKYSSRVSHNMDDWFFKIFKGHINYVQNLYCIGLSFQDQHVNNVLYEWLSFSKERKLIIVNPFIKQIPTVFSHLPSQIEIINMGFFEFLNKDSSKGKMKLKFNTMLRNLGRYWLLKLGKNITI